MATVTAITRPAMTCGQIRKELEKFDDDVILELWGVVGVHEVTKVCDASEHPTAPYNVPPHLVIREVDYDEYRKRKEDANRDA